MTLVGCQPFSIDWYHSETLFVSSAAVISIKTVIEQTGFATVNLNGSE